MRRLIASLLGDVRQNVARGVVSGASMFLGILCLVAVSAAGTLAANYLTASEEQKNGRASTYSASVMLSPSALPSTVDDITGRFSARLGRAASRFDLELTSTALLIPSGSPTNDPGTAVSTIWMTGPIDAIRRLAPIDTRRSSLDTIRPELYVNEALAQRLKLHRGSRLDVGDSNDRKAFPFAVVGVVSDGLGDPQAYGDLHVFAKLFPLTGSAPAQAFFSSPSADLAAATAMMTETIGDAGLAFTDQVRRADSVDQVRSQVALVQAIFSVISILFLAIAGLGILNVGLASIGERSRELVVRRAIGARRVDVFVLVTGSAVVASIPVAVAATGVAVALSVWIVPALLPTGAIVDPPPFPWSACVVGVAAATGTALLASLLPAVKATRLPIALALRE